MNAGRNYKLDRCSYQDGKTSKAIRVKSGYMLETLRISSYRKVTIGDRCRQSAGKIGSNSEILRDYTPELVRESGVRV